MNNRENTKMSVYQKLWSDRGKLGENKQKRMLLDFMPAALEIQERPPSPMGRFIGWLIIALFCICVLWAIFSHVNVFVTAEGKVVPTGKVKIVQSSEEGKIKTILIKDGQKVSAGDPLIAIDETFAEADKRRLTVELRKAKLNIQRYQAELGQKVVLGEDMLVSDRTEDVDASLLTTQRLYAANTKAFNEQLEMLKSDLSQSKAAQIAAKGDLARLQTKVEYYQDLLPKRQKQADIGLVAGQEVDDIAFQLETAKKEFQSAKGRLQESSANLRGTQERLKLATSENKSELLRGLAEAEYEHNSLLQELVKVQGTLSQQVIEAPIDGIIQQLAVNTKGGYISRGQELMVIVPEDSALQLDIKILDKDIGLVEQGMTVEAVSYTHLTLPTTPYV